MRYKTHDAYIDSLSFRIFFETLRCKCKCFKLQPISALQQPWSPRTAPAVYRSVRFGPSLGWIGSREAERQPARIFARKRLSSLERQVAARATCKTREGESRVRLLVTPLKRVSLCLIIHSGLRQAERQPWLCPSSSSRRVSSRLVSSRPVPSRPVPSRLVSSRLVYWLSCENRPTDDGRLFRFPASFAPLLKTIDSISCFDAGLGQPEEKNRDVLRIKKIKKR